MKNQPKIPISYSSDYKKGKIAGLKEGKLLCPTCNKGELYTFNGYIWCNNKKCEAIFEQQDTID